MCAKPTANPGPETLVSVILPTYQGEHLILRAVHSVLNQTHRHLELIVIDDGSTDGTQALLSQIGDPRLKVLTQANQGVAVARNHGLSQAQGEYIAFLDTDDLWHPRYLEVSLATLARHGQPVGIVYSSYYAVNDHERLINLPPIYHQTGPSFEAVLHYEGILLPSTAVAHRDIVQAVGGFPAESYHEDRVFFIRACRDYPIFPTGQRLVVYRQSLSGRCRRILQDFDTALQAECSITETLQNDLTPETLALLERLQVRNLFYRMLMYNYLPSARRLYPQLDKSLLKDKKGCLAGLSMRLGINVLMRVRQMVQWGMKTLLYRWWQKQRQPYYSGLSSSMPQSFKS